MAVALLALAGGLALPETSRISLHDVSPQVKGTRVAAAL
jgi:MHS family proline/betaine transporter-like MFS transporter